jgi:hexosaminidase
MGVNYAKSIYNITGKVAANNGVSYELSIHKIPTELIYVDGTDPTATQDVKTVLDSKSLTIKSAYFENGQLKSAVSSQDFTVSKTTGKK